MGMSPVSTLGVYLPLIVQVPVCTSMQVVESVCFSSGGISEVSFGNAGHTQDRCAQLCAPMCICMY